MRLGVKFVNEFISFFQLNDAVGGYITLLLCIVYSFFFIKWQNTL